MVQKEKEDMLHVLDFPYNGETRFNHIMEGKITDNKYHLYVESPSLKIFPEVNRFAFL